MPSGSGTFLVGGALRSTLKLAQKSYNFLNNKQQSRKAKRKEKKRQRKLQRQYGLYGHGLPETSSTTSAGLASTSSSSTLPVENRQPNNHKKHKWFSGKYNSKQQNFDSFNNRNKSSTTNNFYSPYFKKEKNLSLTSKVEENLTTTQVDSSFNNNNSDRNFNNSQQQQNNYSDEEESEDYYNSSCDWSSDTTALLEFDTSGPQKSPFTSSLRAKYLCLNPKDPKDSVESTTTTITTTTSFSSSPSPSSKENGELSNKPKKSRNNIQNELGGVSSGQKVKSPSDCLSSKMNGINNMPSSNGGTATINVPRLAEPKYVLYSRDHIQPGWKQKMPVSSGLINMGNSCYLNATLQALLHTPAFINWLMNDEEHKRKCRNNSQFLHQCTICAMSTTMFEAFNRTNQAIRPIQIYNRLKVICKSFQQGRQEDAHEFLRYLLESMERSYLNAINGQKLDNRSKETTPLGQIFGGYLRTEVTCLQCKNMSTTFQPLAELQLDIRHVSTLEDAIQNHFKKERLDYNDYKCEKCHKSSLATKQFSLEIPPIVLCLQLKRFTPYGTKISKPIHCNRTLNLRRYLHKSHTDSNDVDAVYRLVGLVTHIGSSPNCGHYTAIAEAPNGQFYQFDDSYVRQTSINGAQSSDAYVIMYEIDRSKKNQSPTRYNNNNKNNNRPINSNTSSHFEINKNIHKSSTVPSTTIKPSSSIASCTSTSMVPKAPPILMKASSPPKSIFPRSEKVNGVNGVSNHTKTTINKASEICSVHKPKINGEVASNPKLQNNGVQNGLPHLKRSSDSDSSSQPKAKKPAIDTDLNEFKIKQPVNDMATANIKVPSVVGETNANTVKRVNSEAGRAKLKIKNGPSFALVPYNDDEDEAKDGDEGETSVGGTLLSKNPTKLVKSNDDTSPRKVPSKLVKSPLFQYSKQVSSHWNSPPKFNGPIIKSWNAAKPSILYTYVNNDRKRAFQMSKEELEDQEIDAGKKKKLPKLDSSQVDSKPSLFNNFATAPARIM